MKPLKDLTGKRFGRLQAMFYAGQSKWFCRCDCGGETFALTSNLLKGNSTSCGCKRAESRYKHGMSREPQWHAWQMMRQRCENPSDPAFKNYGGRGIRVCERWQVFANFLADMGLRPTGFELDRIDNDGDYTPKNCRWVSKKQNRRNKRTNRIIEWNGEALPLAVWAERLHIDPGTLFNRIERGWHLEEAMTKPVQKRRKD